MKRADLPVAILAALCLWPGSALAYPRQSEITRGRALATAADCTACHTAKDAEPFAGGRPIPTPFGKIYAPNITFDKDTGIGGWSEADFYSALHSGIDDEGNHIYPAMPYNYLTKMPRRDVDAIYTYLKTLPHVHHEVKAPELRWPFSWRWLMTFWNWLFFDEGHYRPDPKRSVAWNRGAYLVEGPGHCGACHTPANVFGAPERGDAYQGNEVDHWFAPPLTKNDRSGLGRWSGREIVQFLKTGGTDRTAAYGPMAEVIADSTSKMSDGDLAAIAVYLRSQQAGETQRPEKPDKSSMAAGGQVFAAQCAACHQAQGKGQTGMFASLKGNSNVQATNPATVIHAILTGVRGVQTDKHPTGPAMPPFDWKLDDKEVAAVATYIRNSWGNAAPAVSAGDVSAIRDATGAKEAGQVAAR